MELSYEDNRGTLDPRDKQDEILSENPNFIPSVSEQVLAQKFQNLGLNHDGGFEAKNSFEGFPRCGRYPLRPYAEDCVYYLRTGLCKFRDTCKFNHPVKRYLLKGDKGEEGNERERVKGDQTKCKYFFTAAGCKNGDACRFSHFGEHNEIEEPDTNFLDLPIRPGQRKCPFYLETGSCAYGATCRYDHPDPSAVLGSKSHDFVLNHDNTRGLHLSSVNQNYEASPFESLGKPQPRKWDGYQASINRHEETGLFHSACGMSNLTKRANSSRVHNHGLQANRFSERPGQPECLYFMKTGDCKFKSACQYHHPKNHVSKSLLAHINYEGLPLRPGKKICMFYEKNGTCKYGTTCLFDHPVNYGRI